MPSDPKHRAIKACMIALLLNLPPIVEPPSPSTECPLQSSQIVSKSKSALLSPPQILHRFLSLPRPTPRNRGISRLPFLRLLRPPSPSSLSSPSPASARSAASFSRSIRSSSSWASDSSSSSGASSMVSREEMDGLRDRAEVGVLGMLVEKLELEA